jgi:DNA-binding CsgD family transcriptional regulator
MEDLVEALLRSVKRVCNAGLDSRTLRRNVAQLVAPQLAFDAYAFSTCDPDTGLMTHVVADGVPPAVARTYVNVLYPDHCARLAIDMPRRGIAVFSMLEHSRETRSVLAAHGLHEQLHVSLDVNGRLWGTWCLMRERPGGRSQPSTRSLLQRMVPHLARALQMAALIDRGLNTSSHEAAAATSPGVVVLDSRNRSVLQTPWATRWLEDIADIGLHMPNALPLAVIALVTRLRRSRDDGATCQLRARGASGRLYTVRASLAEPDPTGEAATVIVIQPAAPREIASMLTQLYDLSAREREVVAGVARGQSTKAIAASLGVSSHTIIEHIERACGKIGVRGRKALIAKLFFDGYAPLIGGPASQQRVG